MAQLQVQELAADVMHELAIDCSKSSKLEACLGSVYILTQLQGDMGNKPKQAGSSLRVPQLDFTDGADKGMVSLISSFVR